MKTILLVDDEYAFVETLTELLGDEGFRVVSAANGRDGLQRLLAEKPDLVITDLMMPIADGRELLRGMRALPEFRSRPVIMLSATTRPIALGTGEGALDVSVFLGKPVAWEKLIEVIVGLIGPGDPRATRPGS